MHGAGRTHPVKVVKHNKAVRVPVRLLNHLAQLVVGDGLAQLRHHALEVVGGGEEGELRTGSAGAILKGAKLGAPPKIHFMHRAVQAG